MIHNTTPLKVLPSLPPCLTAPACWITYCFSAKHGPRPQSDCKLCCTKPFQLSLRQEKCTNISHTSVSGLSCPGCTLRKTHSSVRKLIGDVSRHSQVAHHLICHWKTPAGGPISKQSILPWTLWREQAKLEMFW